MHLFKPAEAVTAPIRLRVGRRNLTRFYSGLVAPGQLAFDVGANVGEHTRVLLDLGLRVVSVEPQASVAAELARRYGDRATVIAAGGESGELDLHLSADSNELATLLPEQPDLGRFRHGWGLSNVSRW
jgi:hypothetical protein